MRPRCLREEKQKKADEEWQQRKACGFAASPRFFFPSVKIMGSQPSIIWRRWYYTSSTGLGQDFGSDSAANGPTLQDILLNATVTAVVKIEFITACLS